MLGARAFGFSELTAGRAPLLRGDQVAFYAAGEGVIATATVETPPGRRPHPLPKYAGRFPWVFTLTNVKSLPYPVVIDRHVRAQLDAFEGRDLTGVWSWFVQQARRISDWDFDVLTGARR